MDNFDLKKYLAENKLNEAEKEINPITKKKFDNLLALAEKAVANKDMETLYKIYNKGLNTGSKGWSYFIDSLVDKGLARIDDRGMLKFNLEESNLNEAGGKDLYNTAGQMISQVGLFTQENADEMEADGSGNLYRFFDTPEERDELIKISEGYKTYLAKVKAMMDELMSDPMYQVAKGDAGRNENPLEKAYYRAKNI